MRVAQSSHIQAHDYDPQTQTLLIQFTNGAVYTYGGVSASEYYNFSQAPSPGTYFWTKIRDQYSTTPIAPGDKKSRRR